MLTNSRDIIRRLRDEGFVHRSTRGSHHKFRHPDSRVVVVVHPKRPVGTVRAIYKQAGWETD